MQIYFCNCISSTDEALLKELNSYLPAWLSSWVGDNRLRFTRDQPLVLDHHLDARIDQAVLFVSRAGLETPWVVRELEWATRTEEKLQRRFVLPVLIDDVGDEVELQGLDRHAMLDIADQSAAGTRMLAERLTNYLGSCLTQAYRALLTTTTFTVDSAGIARDTMHALHHVPAPWRDTVDEVLTRPFLDGLLASHTGRIPLTPPQYYQRINVEMSAAGAGARIFAVSTLSSKLWRGDIDQQEYADRNLLAVSRGASIQRLFIISPGDEDGFAETLQAQVDGGIEVAIATTSVFANVPELEDFVMFSDDRGSRPYISLAAVDGTRRIRSGALDVAPNSAARLRFAFERAWDLAVPAHQVLKALAEPGATSRSRRPGQPAEALSAVPLARRVGTPEEAAEVRGTPLANELRTRILRTNDGLVAAHLPADGVLSLAKVQKYFSGSVHVATNADLVAAGIAPDSTCALATPVWDLPHLVTRRLLDVDPVFTVDPTRSGYYEFDAVRLVEAAQVRVDDFEV